jgi:hypothetical protein
MKPWSTLQFHEGDALILLFYRERERKKSVVVGFVWTEGCQNRRLVLLLTAQASRSVSLTLYSHSLYRFFVVGGVVILQFPVL